MRIILTKEEREKLRAAGRKGGKQAAKNMSDEQKKARATKASRAAAKARKEKKG